MTTVSIRTPPDAAAEIPWYELINDAPEPPEDALQESTTIMYVTSILRARYHNDRTVLVSRRTNVIYDSEVPGSVIVPDGYVVFGVDRDTIEMYRRSYRIDEWGVAPAFVLEVATENTALRDLTEKRTLYARMGAQEYWRLDRTGNYYGEPLVGERLVNGAYERLPLRRAANGDVWSRSEALGVDFSYRVGERVGRFLLHDSVTGKWLRDLAEEIAVRQEAEAQAEQAARAEAEARADAMAARNRELEAELERLRRPQQG